LLSADSVRSLSRYPVDGITEVIEMQNNLLVGALAHSGMAVLDSSRVTWGLQARRSAASSRGVVFNDVVNGPPIVINQQAAYAQIESRPAPSLHLVLAARYDHHPHLDARISPKLGLLYDIDASRVVRLTYNGAFVAPGILQMEARTINAGAGTAGVGNGYGFTIKDASGTTVNQIARLRPELNETWELGFKGLVTSQLSADATVYMTHVHNFMTLTGPFNNVRAAAPTFAYYGKTGERITDNAGNPLALVTYINVGDGRFSGLDAALRYSLTDRVLITSTASVTRVIKIHSRPQDPPDATAFNSSGFRTVLQMEYENPGRGLSLSARTRYVKGYEFRSGVDWGRIPTFGTLGASASWRVQKSGVTLLAQAENIATCVSGTTTPPVSGINFASRSTYLSHRECGIDFQHRELMNMPAVGMTIFGGVRWERR